MRRLLSILGVWTLAVAPAQADLITIDFESFSPGANLATVNATTSPLGATFDAIISNSFRVLADPNNSANNVVTANTLPFFADILVNFAFEVDYVRVVFPNDPSALNGGVSLTAYDHTGTADTIQGSGGVLGRIEVTEPGFIEFSARGIRAIQLESNVNLYIDDVQFRPYVVPEPTSLLSAITGLALMGSFAVVRSRQGRA